jgi:hypothetical protein
MIGLLFKILLNILFIIIIFMSGICGIIFMLITLFFDIISYIIYLFFCNKYKHNLQSNNLQSNNLQSNNLQSNNILAEGINNYHIFDEMDNKNEEIKVDSKEKDI